MLFRDQGRIADRGRNMPQDRVEQRTHVVAVGFHVGLGESAQATSEQIREITLVVVGAQLEPRLLGGRGLGFFGALRLRSGLLALSRLLSEIFEVDLYAEVDVVVVLRVPRGFNDIGGAWYIELVAGHARRPIVEITNKFDAGLTGLPKLVAFAIFLGPPLSSRIPKTSQVLSEFLCAILL